MPVPHRCLCPHDATPSARVHGRPLELTCWDFVKQNAGGRSAGQGDGKLELQSDHLGFMKDHSAAFSVSSCLIVTFTIIFNTMWTFRHCLSMGLWGDFLVRPGEHTCP